MNRHQIRKDDVRIVASDVEARAEGPTIDGQVNKPFYECNLLLQLSCKKIASWFKKIFTVLM